MSWENVTRCLQYQTHRDISEVVTSTKIKIITFLLISSYYSKKYLLINVETKYKIIDNFFFYLDLALVGCCIKPFYVVPLLPYILLWIRLRTVWVRVLYSKKKILLPKFIVLENVWHQEKNCIKYMSYTRFDTYFLCSCCILLLFLCMYVCIKNNIFWLED